MSERRRTRRATMSAGHYCSEARQQSRCAAPGRPRAAHVLLQRDGRRDAWLCRRTSTLLACSTRDVDAEDMTTRGTSLRTRSYGTPRTRWQSAADNVRARDRVTCGRPSVYKWTVATPCDRCHGFICSWQAKRSPYNLLNKRYEILIYLTFYFYFRTTVLQYNLYRHRVCIVPTVQTKPSLPPPPLLTPKNSVKLFSTLKSA